ncbi:MAG TPA: hypothetical protein PKA58_29940, partial [Polyangium sp.]|nr:hypothetical protein [Polyangium sp.]
FLMGFVATIAPNAEQDTNEMVFLGQHTILLDVLQLGQSPTYENMHVRLYEGRAFVDANGTPTPPQWNGTDDWPVAPESVIDGVLESPASETLDGYIADEGDGGTFVGRFGGSIPFYIVMYPLQDEHGLAHLRIHHPLVTMRFSADRRRVESGVIAGFLNAEEITSETVRMMDAFDAKYCGSNTEQTLRVQTQLQSDILLDGELDMTKTCDSFSIGLEFEAERAEIGAIAAPAPPLWDPCAGP